MNRKAKEEALKVLMRAVSSSEWNEEIANQTAEEILTTIQKHLTPRGDPCLDRATKLLLTNTDSGRR
jgi:hypothetical protein